MRAAEQDEVAIAQARQEWRAELEAISPERLVFLDESAVLTSMVRTHARSLQGTRALGAIACSHWTRLSVLGALGTEGILAAMSIEAATDADVLLRLSRPGAPARVAPAQARCRAGDGQPLRS